MISAFSAVAPACPEGTSECSDATSEGLETISGCSNDAIEYPGDASEGADTLLRWTANSSLREFLIVP
jgi:hypothetical protein